MAIHQLTNTAKTLKRGELIVNGHSLLGKRMMISKRPIIGAPERQIDFHTSRGTDGFLVIDHGTFGERKGTIELTVLSRDDAEAEQKRSYLMQLMETPVEVYFYNYPFASYQGRVAIEELKQVGSSAVYQLDFKLQPYRRFNSELNRLTLRNNDSIQFDKGRLVPKFIIDGTGGQYDLHIGGELYRFVNVPSGRLFFDCITKQTYQIAGHSTVNRSDVKINKRYPVYRSGDVITWQGNITGVSVEFIWEGI